MLIGEYTERCMDPEIGMNKDAAKKFAESLAGNDIESAFKCLAEHIKVTKSDMEQEFYKNRKIRERLNKEILLHYLTKTEKILTPEMEMQRNHLQLKKQRNLRRTKKPELMQIY